ncbi:unnamed protein product [Amoebophrya sp. A120]|nr:unnamed protein product [Amoebophrya sp. A120]|eukprot:GSA120T00011402001.1
MKCLAGHPLVPQESLAELSALAGGTKYIHGVRCDLCGVSSRHRVPAVRTNEASGETVFSYHCQPCGYDLCVRCANESLGLDRGTLVSPSYWCLTQPALQEGRPITAAPNTFVVAEVVKSDEEYNQEGKTKTRSHLAKEVEETADDLAERGTTSAASSTSSVIFAKEDHVLNRTGTDEESTNSPRGKIRSCANKACGGVTLFIPPLEISPGKKKREQYVQTQTVEVSFEEDVGPSNGLLNSSSSRSGEEVDSSKRKNGPHSTSSASSTTTVTASTSARAAPPSGAVKNLRDNKKKKADTASSVREKVAIVVPKALFQEVKSEQGRTLLPEDQYADGTASKKHGRGGPARYKSPDTSSSEEEDFFSRRRAKFSFRWNLRAAYRKSWYLENGRFVREHDRHVFLAQEMQEQGSLFSHTEKEKSDLIRQQLGVGEEEEPHPGGPRNASAQVGPSLVLLQQDESALISRDEQSDRISAPSAPPELVFHPKKRSTSSDLKDTKHAFLRRETTTMAAFVSSSASSASSKGEDGEDFRARGGDRVQEDNKIKESDSNFNLALACFAIDGVRGIILWFAADFIFPVQFLLLNASLWSKEFSKWIAEDLLIWQQAVLHLFPTVNPHLRRLDLKFLRRRLEGTWLFRDNAITTSGLHRTTGGAAATSGSDNFFSQNSAASTTVRPRTPHASPRSPRGAGLGPAAVNLNSPSSNASFLQAAPRLGLAGHTSSWSKTTAGRSKQSSCSEVSGTGNHQPALLTSEEEASRNNLVVGNSSTIAAGALSSSAGVVDPSHQPHPKSAVGIIVHQSKKPKFPASHAVENCDRPDCPMTWESLQYQSRESEHIRVCQQCRCDVFYAEDIENAVLHARREHKFAVGNAQHRYQDGISKCCRAHLRNNVR